MSKLKITGALVVILAIATIFLGPITRVPEGHVGLVLTSFGTAFRGKTLTPGIHFRIPFYEAVVKMDIRLQSVPVDTALAYTKESQTVSVKSKLNYNIDPSVAGLLYKEIGQSVEEKVVIPTVQEAIKKVIAKYTALEIPSSRGKIADEIEDDIRSRLLQSHLLVSDYIFENEDFDDAYEAAIREKQTAEQNALKEKNITASELEKKKQEILKAEALAEKTRLEVEALTAAGGDKALEKMKIEAMIKFADKWNGQVPQNSVFGGTILDSLLQKIR